MTHNKNECYWRTIRIDAIRKAYDGATNSVRARMDAAFAKQPLEEWSDRDLINFAHCIHNGQLGGNQ
jgi:hypothetical protein